MAWRSSSSRGRAADDAAPGAPATPMFRWVVSIATAKTPASRPILTNSPGIRPNFERNGLRGLERINLDHGVTSLDGCAVLGPGIGRFSQVAVLR